MRLSARKYDYVSLDYPTRTAQRFALLAGGRAWIMLIIVGNAEARKMFENAAESHQSSARFVGQGT